MIINLGLKGSQEKFNKAKIAKICGEIQGNSYKRHIRERIMAKYREKYESGKVTQVQENLAARRKRIWNELHAHRDALR